MRKSIAYTSPNRGSHKRLGSSKRLRGEKREGVWKKETKSNSITRRHRALIHLPDKFCPLLGKKLRKKAKGTGPEKGGNAEGDRKANLDLTKPTPQARRKAASALGS